MLNISKESFTLKNLFFTAGQFSTFSSSKIKSSGIELIDVQTRQSTLEEIFVLFEKSKANSLLSNFKNTDALQSTDIPNEQLQRLTKLKSNITFAEKKLKSVYNYIL